MEDDATQLVIQLEDNLGLGEVRNGIPLIGVLMADKLPNQDAVKGILRKSWEQMGKVKISIVKDNMLAITVKSEEMAGRIMEGGPWAVMGYALSTHRWEEGMAIEEVNRHSITYWVQVSKIPLEKMNQTNTRKIGATLGRVVEVDDPNQTEGYRGFLRLKVELDASKPLVEGFWIPRRNRTELWAEIRYERLADYCYHCGRLGHPSDLCRFLLVPLCKTQAKVSYSRSYPHPQRTV